MAKTNAEKSLEYKNFLMISGGIEVNSFKFG